MEITSTTYAPPANARPGGAEGDSTSKISSDFETFLKMLTVQMQNQDPLNPVKSEDFAVQLATFSGVEQQVRTNDLLESLGAQMGVTGLSSLAGWVGMEVRAEVPARFDGEPINLSFAASTADRRELIVTDANGDIVQRVALSPSDREFSWDGLADDGLPFTEGAYGFEIAEIVGEEVAGTTPVSIYTRVTEARAEGGVTMLVTESGALVQASEVSALREPSQGLS